MTIEEALLEEVDLKHLLKKTSFAEEDIIRAALEQPTLYLDAVRLRVQANRETQKRETQFELIKSELSKDIRHKRAVKTEGHLREILMRKEVYRTAKQKFEFANNREEFMEHLLRMFQMRAQSIKVVQNLMGAEGASESRRLANRQGERERDEVRERARKKYGN